MADDLDRAALDRYITIVPEPVVFRCDTCGESSEDHEQFHFEAQRGYARPLWVCPEYTSVARVMRTLADMLYETLATLEDHVLTEPDEDVGGHVCREHCPC